MASSAAQPGAPCTRTYFGTVNTETVQCAAFFLLGHLLRFEEQGVRRGLRIARPKSRSA